jgi:segregation and condensation protein B
MLQPVTAYEIQAARKVRNTDAIRTLLRRKLIAPAGRARGRGKALQYRTTPQFLVEFGLQDLSELPKVEAFQQVPGIKIGSDPGPAGALACRREELLSQLEALASAAAGSSNAKCAACSASKPCSMRSGRR